MPFLKRRAARKPAATLFFATDLHGSDHCFRKFLNARGAYGADTLILGGDMTGKLAVPIVRESETRLTVYSPGTPQRVETEDELSFIDEQLRKAGFYPFRASPDELQEFAADPELVDKKLHELMKQRLARWSEWAEEKLADSDIEIIVAPGNDDPWELDDVIRDLPRFRLVENQVVDDALNGAHVELLSTGVSNPTPWKTHRELAEEDLTKRLEELAERVRNPEMAIFNIHVPPFGSQLDEGPMIDADTLKQTVGFGQDVTVPVGSKAVKAILEQRQPLLSLHGHIHESRGITRIGRTVAINPGSDYSDGILRGAFVQLDQDGIINQQLTSG